MDIYQYLKEHNISYQKFDHPAVFTCEEAERLCLKMPGESIKNLFLRNQNKKRYFLVIVSKEKHVDLKALKDELNTSKLSFGSSEDLKKYLGVEPGSVTLLSVINDLENKVEIIIDRELRDKNLQCHPLVNTATLVISAEGIKKFLEKFSYKLLTL